MQPELTELDPLETGSYSETPKKESDCLSVSGNNRMPRPRIHLLIKAC